MRADLPQSGKVDWPPLLEPGIHSFTLGSFRDLAVEPFADSRTREKLFAGLREVIGRLNEAGLCGTLFVDGSYLTHKPDPGDADMVLEVPHNIAISLTREQHERLIWYVDEERKSTHGCDTYAFATHPEGHPLHRESAESREYWMDLFGHGHNRQPKGIAALATCEHENG